MDPEHLMRSCGLTEREWKKKIRNIHLQRISQNYCHQWENLIPHLGMKAITEHDIERSSGSPGKKRRRFLFKWEEEKGSEATYEKLISALLEIKCKEDAEGVCRLLQNSSPSPPQPQRRQQVNTYP